MIQARKLVHLVLKVRDARASRDFSTQALGLKVSHEDLEHGAVFLSFGREHHELALFQLATGEPPSAAQPGMHHMAWRLGSFEELRDAYRELKAMGFEVESTVEHNVTRSVYFVGTNNQGLITLFRGLPYDLPLGVHLYTPRYVSGVPALSIPAGRRKRVLDHQLRSRGDAADLIRSLDRSESP